MQIYSVQAHCNELAMAMGTKGFDRPECAFTIKSNEEAYAFISWVAPGSDSWKQDFVFHHAGTPEECFAKARAWLAIQPSMADRKKQAAIELTAKALEAAREAGMMDDFLEPILAMMKKLSTNAITAD